MEDKGGPSELRGGGGMKNSPFSTKHNKPFAFKPPVIPPDMVVIVDTREQNSPFLIKPPKGLTIVRDTLVNGDYGIRGFPDFAIERKFIGDIFPYCSTEQVKKTKPKMERFRDMIKAGGWVGLAIQEREADIYNHQQWTNISPESVRQAICSFEIRYGVHIYFNKDKDRLVMWMLDRMIKYYNMMKKV
jgi:ERCC4-type nuclease